MLAKNALDGSLYGSIVVPISGNGKGSKDETLRALIANVKATDSQYARLSVTPVKRLLIIITELWNNCSESSGDD